ncbi:MAG: AbrB/MazE/SpoVT family DNA-binding domain-containing protein [Anaerolineae bacterium]
MARKVFRSGNSAVVSIPPEVLEVVGLQTGDAVTVVADVEGQRIIVTPATPDLPGVRQDLLEQVDRFIQRYRPALEKLASE